MDVPLPMYPYGKPLYKPYIMCYNPQESLENTLNTMGTLLGVHPIVPLLKRTATTPENGWLVQLKFLSGPGLFSGGIC